MVRTWQSLYNLSALAILLMLSFSLVGCGKLKVKVRDIEPENLLDFLKTEIINNGIVPADGISDLVVVIHLKNSDNSSVPDFMPTYEVSSGSNVITSQCTKSDSNGIAVCILKSTSAGAKKIRLTNAKIGLEHEVIFGAPSRPGQGLELVSGSVQNGTTAGGYKAKMSVGAAVQGIQVTTPGGYKGKLSVQGATLAR